MNEEGTVTARPFLKWVGGKGKLMPQLLQLVPKKYNNYYEPFLGGGAFYFALPTAGKSFLNDINQHLIAAYIHIRDDLDRVIAELKIIREEYNALDEDAKKSYYLDRRKEYNALTDSNLRKTVLLIFLNKTCFNGIYRENRKGEFNVPFGNQFKPNIPDEHNLANVSRKLQHAEFSHGSYEAVVSTAKKGDFIYFDPPYFPLTPTSNFTSYHASGFAKSDQEKLRDTFAALDKKGCFVMLSNSAAADIREFYKMYRQESILAARAVNAVGTGRGKVTELVILNY